MSVTTPNMGLTQPTVGVDSGLSWENATNANAGVLDQHNHAPGSGVQITPTGLNINSSLSFQNQLAISLGGVVFTQMTNLTNLNSLFFKTDGNAYINDGAGNQIQVTSGGAVNATSSGISSGSATASFVSSVLVVNAASNTPANIQGGSLLLGNNTSGSKFLTLSPPSSMASNFTLTLPSIPVQTNLVTLDTSGNIAAVTNVDNSTLIISSNLIEVNTAGIGTTQLANGSVTRPKLAALGQQISLSSGTFSTTSTSFVDVTNLSVTITTSGRPIYITLNQDGGSAGGTINTAATSSGQRLVFLRNGTIFYNYTSQSGQANFPASAFNAIDVQSAGTYTYKVQIASPLGGSISVVDAILIAYEM